MNLENLKKKFDVRYDEKLCENEKEIISIIKDYDGLIVRNKTKVNSDILKNAIKLKLIEKLELPKVLISSGLDLDQSDSIKTNDEEISIEMTNYLIKSGHRKIAFIKGHPTHVTTDIFISQVCVVVSRLTV